jgi:SAM-dependent methyltransferase
VKTIEERYDRSALAYRRWWEPVLAPTALGLLDRLEASGWPDSVVPNGSTRDGRRADGKQPGGERPGGTSSPAMSRLLDVGTGAGVLAIAAARRWPKLEVVGLDGSAEMLAVAKAAWDERRGDQAVDRIRWVRGHAGQLPFESGLFDAVVSSFVYQLVPDLSRALAEALRVLRPGGRLAIVTWRVGDDRFAPDEAFEAAIDDLELDFDEADQEEPRSGDFASAAATASRLRRLGFRRVVAREAWLEHDHDPATYADFLESYAESETFGELEPADRERLRERTLSRLGRLPREAFRWRVPVVSVVAERPT